MKHALFILVILLSACVGGTGGTSIENLLIGREVVYESARPETDPTASRQIWTADGRTTFIRPPGLFGGTLHGRWFVENGLYCDYYGSQKREDRDCWRVTTSADGQSVRFKKTGFKLIDFGPDEYNGRFVK